MRPTMLVLCAVLLWPAGSFAATYLVRPDGLGDFPTIQAAIDAAVEGDVVQLADGTFIGTGNRALDYHGKRITVCSQAGDPSLCVMDCQGVGSAVTFQSGEDSTAILRGITLTHAVGAVSCWRSSPRITGCVFSANTGGGGTAIRIDSVYGQYIRPIIEWCTFAGNIGGTYGPICGWYSSPRITDCTFSSNCGSHGGAMYFGYGSPIIRRCNFTGNWTHTDGEGGAIHFHAPLDTGPLIADCLFEGNSSGGSLGHGGAVSCFAGALLTIERCTFLRNDGYEGGGIYCDGSGLLVRSCTLVGNAASSAGGGIFADYEGPFLVENTIVASGSQGAAVACGHGGSITLTCCDLFNNAGGDWTGCITNQLGVRGNVAADPLFCDPANDTYSLDLSSPCAPAQNPLCGLVGAWPVACPVSSVGQGGIPRLTLQVAPVPCFRDCRLSFTAPSGGRVLAEIIDVSGRVVRRLTTESVPPGRSSIVWDGRDETGGAAPAGVYLARVRVGFESSACRVVLVR